MVIIIAYIVSLPWHSVVVCDPNSTDFKLGMRKCRNVEIYVEILIIILNVRFNFIPYHLLCCQ